MAQLRDRRVLQQLLAVTIDTSVSVTASTTINGISDDTGTPGDGVTRDNTLIVYGTSNPNGTVSLSRDGSYIGSASVDGSGNWSFDDSYETLSDGSHTFYATGQDALGNHASSSFSLTIDTGGTAVNDAPY